jgi:PIN domain nuclease of toxin-antitoxin system
MMRAERGAERVLEALPEAVVSSINAAEVVTKLIRQGAEPDAARLAMVRVGCPIIPVDTDLALRAGTLASITARRGLSVGDRCCLALAEREGAAALTADRAWIELDLAIGVVLIR